MQGSVQGENVGALVQKQEKILLSSVASLSTVMVSFYLLFNVAFLKAKRTSSSSTDHRKCPMPPS